ncbi:hypothetical protein K1719_007351 [Acacia pycnantha]|nr:hypothetical protein K1719_007351 [Acacia pycnantha]
MLAFTSRVAEATSSVSAKDFNIRCTEAPTESYDTFDQIGTLRTVLFELCIFSFDVSIFLLDFVKISRTLGGYSYSPCHITHDHHMEFDRCRYSKFVCSAVCLRFNLYLRASVFINLVFDTTHYSFSFSTDSCFKLKWLQRSRTVSTEKLEVKSPTAVVHACLN